MRVLVAHAAKDLRIEAREPEAPGRGQMRINIATGGICGSDLHYFNHGGFGSVRLREPMILGHEVAGHVAEIGPDVAGFAPGDLVAVSPSRPCNACEYCAEGMRNHCLNMQFYGSAMPFPHVQGAFRETLLADAAQCVRADGLSPALAAMAEPLAVCLHAARRAGDLIGKRVLITGCGPIGCLAILAARCAGAADIVATDLSAAALAHAQGIGADRVINIAEQPGALTDYATGKGAFHALFECSGAVAALVAAIPTIRPRGVILQLGLGGDMTLPVQAITAREIALCGCFRFHEEYVAAVRLMQNGQIDPSPLITHTLPLDEALRAFEVASDRSQAMKTQIAFA